MSAELLAFPVDMIVHKATRENTLLRIFASCVKEGVALRGHCSDAVILDQMAKAVAHLNEALSQ